MSERSTIGVTTANVVILATDSITVIAPVPTTMTAEAASVIAQHIFNKGMRNKSSHYDRRCRDDYDIKSYFERELEKAGFEVINTQDWF